MWVRGARFEVPNYWIVDPDLHQVDTFTLKKGVYVPGAVYRAPEVILELGWSQPCDVW